MTARSEAKTKRLIWVTPPWTTRKEKTAEREGERFRQAGHPGAALLRDALVGEGVPFALAAGTVAVPAPRFTGGFL
jgi:hypothetical protein